MTSPLGFMQWFATQETVPRLNADIVKRLQDALPNDPTTTGLALGEPDLWLIASTHFQYVERCAARLTLRNCVVAWRFYQSRHRRAQRARERERVMP